MNDVVIVDAVRTPFGKRGGALSGEHSVELLARVLATVLDRSGVDPASVGQVIGGCVTQVGMQAMNVARQAWLTAGLPADVPSTSVDAQCGSSQQAVTLAHAMVRAGLAHTAVACGVEIMSRVPLGSNVPRDGSLGKAVTRSYWEQHRYTTQFQASELVAQKWGITREDCDRFGLRSQESAARAVEHGVFAGQILPVTVGADPEQTRVFDTDEGPRASTLDGLAGLRTNLPDGVHTAGTSSQVSDGAAALILMSATRAERLGLEPLARIVDSCLVGCDPELMLTGPVTATHKLIGENHLSIGEIDVVEINEAFASVVLAWEREFGLEPERVNPHGGAIALGHPLGATGVALVTKAAHAMKDGDLSRGLVTMCCGGGLGTGTLLQR